MSAVLESGRPVAVPAAPPASPGTTTARIGDGDRLGLVVWLTGAAIMTALLLRDLFFAIVSR